MQDRKIKTRHYRFTADDLRRGVETRAAEIRYTFEPFGKKSFRNALELGCGVGLTSQHLAEYCGHLTATEADGTKLKLPSSESITYAVADAQDLSQFADASMDLVYSSHMLVCLPDIQRCLRECRRVVKPDGLVVHTVPTRAWKASQLLLFYPWRVVHVWRALSRVVTKADDFSEPSRQRRLVPKDSQFDDRMMPRHRGVGWHLLRPVQYSFEPSHWRELLSWGSERWLARFRVAGLAVDEIVWLPFYHGAGYDFKWVKRLGNRLGYSGGVSFILRVSLTA